MNSPHDVHQRGPFLHLHKMCITAVPGWYSSRICARDMAIAPESNGPDANNLLQDVHHRSVYMFAINPRSVGQGRLAYVLNWVRYLAEATLRFCISAGCASLLYPKRLQLHPLNRTLRVRIHKGFLVTACLRQHPHMWSSVTYKR